MSKAPKYECGVCGKRRPAAQMIYSRFTGDRYCASGKLCKRRRARKAVA